MNNYETPPGLTGQENMAWKRSAYLKLGVFFTLLISNLVSLADSGENPVVRGKLPEPFDYFNHAANFVPSMIIVSFPFVLANSLPNSNKYETPKAKRIIAGIGFAAAAAANGVAELKLGISPLTESSTPDPIDAVYGTAAAAFVGYNTATEESSSAPQLAATKNI